VNVEKRGQPELVGLHAYDKGNRHLLGNSSRPEVPLIMGRRIGASFHAAMMGEARSEAKSGRLLVIVGWLHVDIASTQPSFAHHPISPPITDFDSLAI